LFRQFAADRAKIYCHTILITDPNFHNAVVPFYDFPTIARDVEVFVLVSHRLPNHIRRTKLAFVVIVTYQDATINRAPVALLARIAPKI